MNHGETMIVQSQAGRTYVVDMTSSPKSWRGGNGLVRLIKTHIDGFSDGCVIKFFAPHQEPSSEQYRIRYDRFKLEIQTVQALQNEIAGLIPIIDYNCPEFEALEEMQAWYIMPRAKPFKVSGSSISLENKLLAMIDLGRTIHSIHRKNKSHRDIKPSNILIYDGRICLADFGLVWTQETEYLTQTGEKVGPSIILPPELAHIPHNANIDYQKSDSYLFAKVVWMYLTGKENGFGGSYRRELSNKVFNRKILDVETIEPLHRMLEEATLHDYKDRIDIPACLAHIEKQLQVIRHELSSCELASLVCAETKSQMSCQFEPVAQIYDSIDVVFQALSRLLPFVSFSIKFHNQERVFSANRIEKNAHEIILLDVGRDITIRYRLSPKRILVEKNARFQVELEEYTSYPKNAQSIFDPAAFPSADCEFVLDAGILFIISGEQISNTNQEENT